MSHKDLFRALDEVGFAAAALTARNRQIAPQSRTSGSIVVHLCESRVEN